MFVIRLDRQDEVYWPSVLRSCVRKNSWVVEDERTWITSVTSTRILSYSASVRPSNGALAFAAYDTTFDELKGSRLIFIDSLTRSSDSS